MIAGKGLNVYRARIESAKSEVKFVYKLKQKR
jgi:hypothetical protein